MFHRKVSNVEADPETTVLSQSATAIRKVLEQLAPRDPDRNPAPPPGDPILAITIDEGPGG